MGFTKSTEVIKPQTMLFKMEFYLDTLTTKESVHTQKGLVKQRYSQGLPEGAALSLI
jgi:ribosomal protein L35AE/L33A